jgi:hypothetical protein
MPSGVVTSDGSPLQRSTTNGRYQTDAGQDFDVNASSVEAVDPQTGCINTTSEVVLSVTNPFTGVAADVHLVSQ